jgi:putative colanic acid biosynthesis UDP-glucose lipid carrier transferase
MINNKNTFYLLRVFSDYITLLMGFIIAVIITYNKISFQLTTNEAFLFLLLSVVWYVRGKAIGLYDEYRSRNFSFELIALIKNILFQALAAVIILFIIRDIGLNRYFVIVYTAVLLVMLSLEKFSIRRLISYFRKKGRNIRKLLVIGAGDVGKNFFDSVESNPQFGYKIVGFLDDEKKTFLNGQYLGKIDKLNEILYTLEVDDVIVALPKYADEKIEHVVECCRQNAVKLRIIPDYFRFMSNRYSLTMFAQFPMLSVREDSLDQLNSRLLKRAFDFSFSLLLFVFVFSWLWPIIAITIKLSSPGPVFFSQVRVGRRNRLFKTYKFRSMRTDSKDINENGKYQQAKANDPRVTKIGAFLRKSNLDELPQFLNTLKGEMSIVGPRPHPRPLNDESHNSVNLYMQRHLVKPGITGWAQVSGHRGETSKPGAMQARIDHDIWYINNWTFWLDIQIIALTVWNMIVGDKNAY